MDNKPTNEDNQPSFRPASNPFMAGQEAIQDQQVPDKQQSNLVGTKAQDKEDHQEQEVVIPEETLFQWQAPEFVYTQKPFGWFVGIFFFFAGMIALSVWLQNGYSMWVTIALLSIMAVSISVWAGRRPKILIYKITNYGVEVEDRKYLYDDFRAFYEYKDYNQPTLDLVPAKRFGTLVSIPLATPDSDEIKATISQMVPVVEHNEDIIDKLFRRLRF